MSVIGWEMETISDNETTEAPVVHQIHFTTVWIKRPAVRLGGGVGWGGSKKKPSNQIKLTFSPRVNFHFPSYLLIVVEAWMGAHTLPSTFLEKWPH